MVLATIVAEEKGKWRAASGGSRDRGKAVKKRLRQKNGAFF
jgi:hypothetical protein